MPTSDFVVRQVDLFYYIEVNVGTVKIPICFISLVLNIANPIQVLSDDQLLLS